MSARTDTARRSDRTTCQTSTGNRLHPPGETGGRTKSPLVDDAVIRHPPQPFFNHDGNLETGNVVAQAEVLASAEGQRTLNGAVPYEFVGLRILALVAVRRRQQGNDPLAGLDHGVVNGEWSARRSGEPLCGSAVTDHLFARDGHVSLRVCPHGGELIRMTEQLPPSVRPDLG